jgi:hypothetical protein
MSKKPASVPTQSADVPCDPADETATLAFWATAEKHTGLEELRAKRGRPQKAEADLKEQSALRVDAEAKIALHPGGCGVGASPTKQR